MNTQDKEDFRDLVHEIFDKRRSIDDTTHAEDHAYIAICRKNVQKRKEFWEAMRVHLAKWGMLGVASWVFYALWHYFKHNLNGN